MFELVTQKHIDQAADSLDKTGLPKEIFNNQLVYWVELEDGREYPYKELARAAYKIATKKELNFKSSEANRNEFISRFEVEINEYPVGINFFTESELQDFLQYAGENYNPKNEESIEIRNKIYPIFKKTKIWAIEVEKRLSGFKKKGSITWQNWNKFRKYSWLRILDTSLNEENVFFTVGVDSGQSKKVPLSLVIKIDCQWENITGRKLSDEISRGFKSFLKERIPKRKERFKTIKVHELQKYNWESLIQKTVDYIREHQHVYKDGVKLVQGNSINEKRVARLCWNKNNWIEPSGKEGKSNGKKLHENIYGFGHEEWLFDYSRTLKGFQYGFLEPIRQSYKSYTGKKFDIWLYTLDSRTRVRYWVGWIRNLHVLTPEESKEAERKLLPEKVKKENQNQILNVGGIPTDDSEWSDVDVLNVRFKKEDVFYNDPPIKLNKSHPVYKSSYYSLGYYNDAFKVFENNDLEPDLKHPDGEQYNPKPRRKKKHTRSQREVERTYTHDKIRYQLVLELNKEYGKQNVFPERKAGYGRNRVDVIVKDGSKRIYYEIKTQNTIRGSIREALGQIIEYSFWIQEKRADKLVIVTEPLNDLNEAKDYISHLNTVIRFKLGIRTVALKE